jgi:1-acyl-sn-glycerol-3-phosphate acyltransferase
VNAPGLTLPVGAHVPRRGNAFSRWFGRCVLWLFGWRIQGEIPDHPKMVWIGAPHTSNMDGIIAFAALTAMGVRANTMIKDSAFKRGLGPVLRWFGALPVDRSSPRGVVGQSVDAFASCAQMVLLIAPEGTRHSASEWKRGFYHIALGAGVPILAGAVDYRRKLVTLGPLLVPGGDYEADLRQLMTFYREWAYGRYPARMSKPVCEALNLPWHPRS